ncbi:hypothetical protein EUGRSUZ_J03002 [Eucalyptus grandis]|uniref:Uncharacterized protein n=2 Tax=Eucalyptus grandis TaxID=71139 RepID=A0ACC3JAR9_EUCGR|nr:hypothetical protein EUGRSUZ_J03002 [Eucalyptus grandis]
MFKVRTATYSKARIHLPSLSRPKRSKKGNETVIPRLALSTSNQLKTKSSKLDAWQNVEIRTRAHPSMHSLFNDGKKSSFEITRKKPRRAPFSADGRSPAEPPPGWRELEIKAHDPMAISTWRDSPLSLRALRILGGSSASLPVLENPESRFAVRKFRDVDPNT